MKFCVRIFPKPVEKIQASLKSEKNKSYFTRLCTRVNQKVKAIFKLRGNRDREELPHCAVLTVPVEEFSHVQYSALPSVEWQQRGRNMDAPL